MNAAFVRLRFVALAQVVFLLVVSLAPGQDRYAALRHRLVETSIVAEGISNPRVIESMRRTPRHEFVPASERRRAYWDLAPPIGHGQTISQPYIVAFMTEKLDPQPKDKVLEIGTGSGYQAAVLSPLVDEVYTIEIVEPLGRRAAATLRRLEYKNVFARVGDGYKGWPEKAPFDKIIVTCSPENVPAPLVEQLKEGGRIVVPLGERYQQVLYLFTKRNGKLVREALVPTTFVPMTGKAEANRQVKPDPLNPSVVNGGFESVDDQTGRATNWYYQRQFSVGAFRDAPEGRRYITYRNDDPGRLSHSLQAFAVDGRTVRKLVVSLSVKGSGIRPGRQRHEIASAVITFYNSRRKDIHHATIGGWKGTFKWRHVQEIVNVPLTAREALLRIGLHGATGEVSFDRVEMKAKK